MGKIKLALIQHSFKGTKQKTIDFTLESIAKAAQNGANLIALQELHTSEYFCQCEDTRFFQYAESFECEKAIFSESARKNQVVLVTSLFEKRAKGLYHNTAVVFEADGSVAGTYRKSHIPDDPSFYEKFYFTPSDDGFKPIQTSLGKIGVLICWDQWFPEAARLMALAGAEILIYPTAIGWDLRDSEAERTRQLEAWMAVQRGHAVANGIFVCAINRCGVETLALGNISADLGDLQTPSLASSPKFPVKLGENSQIKPQFKRQRRIYANLGSLEKDSLDSCDSHESCHFEAEAEKSNLSLQGKAEAIQQDSRDLQDLGESKKLKTPPPNPLPQGEGEIIDSAGLCPNPHLLLQSKSKQKNVDSRKSKNFFAYFFSEKVSGRKPKLKNNTSPSPVGRGQGGGVISQNNEFMQDLRESQILIDCHALPNGKSRNDNKDSRKSSESNKIFRLPPQNDKLQDLGESPNPSTQNTHHSSIAFWGHSFVFGPQGEEIALASENKDTILYAQIDLNRIDEVRNIWPFLRDRRIECYHNLTKRFID